MNIDATQRIRSFSELRAEFERSAQGAVQQPVKTTEAPVISSPLRIMPSVNESVGDNAIAMSIAASEARRIEKKITDPVTNEEKVVASVVVESEEVPPAMAETKEDSIETLLDSAYSGASPESAQQAVDMFTALLVRQDENLVKMAEAARVDSRQTRAYEMFRSGAEFQRLRTQGAIGILRMLAQGGVALNKDVLSTQRELARNLKKYLDDDAVRIDARLQKYAHEAPVVAIVEDAAVVEAVPELPESPEDIAYTALKEDWRTLRDVYDTKEKAYHEALRAELDANAKSWNPLKSIPYAARKMFGFNQKLSPELGALKAESTASALLYRDASNALAKAKRDTLVKKFEGIDLANEKVSTILARHERMLGRKLVTARAQEHLDSMQQAPSLADHPRMQKALAIMQQTKWARMGGIVGIAALGGLTGGVGAALVAGSMSAGGIAAGMGAAAGVKAGLGEKIKTLLKRNAEHARNESNTEHRRMNAGVAFYDEVFAATERALEKEAMAKKHESYTNLAAAGAAFAAGGAYGSVPETPADALAEAPVAPSSSSEIVPVEQTESTLPLEQVPLVAEITNTPREIFPAPATPIETVRVPEAVPTVEKVASIAPAVHSPMRVPVMQEPVASLSPVVPQQEAVSPIVPVETNTPAQVAKASLETGRSSPSEGLENVVRTEYGLPVQTESGGYLVTESAEEVPAAPVTEQVMPEESIVMPVATPEPIIEIPLAPEVVATIKDIETFNVQKPGFLGMFTTNELQTTGGEVYATIKDLTLGEIEKLYADPAVRTQVFPNGVSPESLDRWATWIQEHNTDEHRAYHNLKLEDFVTQVHRSH